jgi:hypothetical protein
MASGTNAVYAYQWQVSTNSGSTWTNITDGGIYSGTTTASVTVLNASGLNSYQYRCLITYMGNSVITSNAATLTVPTTLTPSVSISTASDTVCSGNSVTFTATGVNPGSGPIYQWKKNSSNLSTGTTITFPSNSLTTGDVITCVLTANNACQTTATATSNAITLTVNQSPVAASISSQYNSSTTALSMCTLGNSVTVYPSIANGVWSSADATTASVARVNSISYSANIKAVANGTTNVIYTLTTANTTCTASSIIAVTVAQQATPSAITIASGATALCVNATDTFKTTSTGGVFSALGRMNINGTNGFATATSAGTTSVKYTITNFNGCSAYSSLNVTVNALPATPSIAFQAGTTNVSGSGGYCKNRTFTLVGNPGNGVWTKTGVVTITPSGTNSTTTSVSTGNVAGATSITYTYTNANGCVSSRTISSNIVTCATKGINNSQLTMDNSQWTVYPNPARSIINLNVKTLVGAGSIVVTDLYGKQLKQQSLSIGTNTIDVSTFAKGMYLVSVITESGKQTQKVIVE